MRLWEASSRLQSVPGAHPNHRHFHDLNMQFESALIWKNPVFTTSLKMNNAENFGWKTLRVVSACLAVLSVGSGTWRQPPLMENMGTGVPAAAM